jgi:nicotinate phosphoribosyltransferase
MRKLSRFERDVVMANGHLRLMQKIKILRNYPEILFSDFGKRRRFSAEWQDYVDSVLRDELSRNFLGTSNTYAAMRTGVVPMGTAAHELFMIIAGITEETGDWLTVATRQVLKDWREEFGWGLAIFLPDTFGSDHFFRLLTPEDLKDWKGFRWDSGDPFEFGDKVIALYERHGIDPKEKLLIPSDGLELETILRLHNYFNGRIKMSYGWGTNLTNDLMDNVWRDDYWYGPLSLVVKPASANGRGLVKLSDNLAKAIGAPADVERYKRAAGYKVTENVECVY